MLTTALICSMSMFITCNTQPIEEVRTVTAYNLVESQCDDTPTIGAFNENLQVALNRGESLCAANFVPKDTILHIEGWGACRVSDRTSRKYGQRVDLLFERYGDAINFGKQRLKVKYSKLKTI